MIILTVHMLPGHHILYIYSEFRSKTYTINYIIYTASSDTVTVHSNTALLSDLAHEVIVKVTGSAT